MNLVLLVLLVLCALPVSGMSMVHAQDKAIQRQHDQHDQHLSADAIAYSPSPNLSLINANIAVKHSCSSSPFVSNRILLPLPAASIMTPIIDLPLTRRLLRLTHTSLLNLLASCVNFADARACNPNLLTISISC